MVYFDFKGFLCYNSNLNCGFFRGDIMKKTFLYSLILLGLLVFSYQLALAKYVVAERITDEESRLILEEKFPAQAPETPEVEETEMKEPVEEPAIEEETLEPELEKGVEFGTTGEEVEIPKKEVEEVKNNGYKLAADDVIQVQVLRHPEFSGKFMVEPNGYISLPYLDPVKAEGLTKYQLRDKLMEILSEFIEVPRVDVRILEYNSQVIYVVGAVAKPGRYSTGGKKMTVRDAIVAAGLPIQGASLRYAYIFSPDPSQPKKAVKLYNLLYRGKMKYNIELNPGDIVYVRSTVISKLGLFLDQLLNPVQRATAIKYIEEAY